MTTEIIISKNVLELKILKAAPVFPIKVILKKFGITTLDCPKFIKNKNKFLMIWSSKIVPKANP